LTYYTALSFKGKKNCVKYKILQEQIYNQLILVIVKCVFFKYVMNS